MFIAPPKLATSTREPQDFSRNGSAAADKTNGECTSGMANPTTRHTTQGTRSLGKAVGQDGLDGTPPAPIFNGTRISVAAADLNSAALSAVDSTLEPFNNRDELIRICAAEQLYRAHTILKGEPYHHP